MTVTRTLNSVQARSYINLQETQVDTADPEATVGIISEIGGDFRDDGTTGPLVTKPYHQLLTMSAGTLTLDLTALVVAGITIDMSGLKLRRILLVAPAANANAITVKPGGTNGYTGWNVGTQGIILNTANDQIHLGPMYGGIVVDGTHKTIDITGTGSQQVNCFMEFGA